VSGIPRSERLRRPHIICDECSAPTTNPHTVVVTKEGGAVERAGVYGEKCAVKVRARLMAAYGNTARVRKHRGAH